DDGPRGLDAGPCRRGRPAQPRRHRARPAVAARTGNGASARARRSRMPRRILAASDEPDPALEHKRNRDELGRLDLIVGCGDLSPEYLSFLGDAFLSPFMYVRGNHDHGGPWPALERLPEAASGLDAATLPGVSMLALSWPDLRSGVAKRD